MKLFFITINFVMITFITASKKQRVLDEGNITRRSYDASSSSSEENSNCLTELNLKRKRDKKGDLTVQPQLFPRKDYIIFGLISKVMTIVLDNYVEISSIINRIYFLQGLGKDQLIVLLLSSLHKSTRSQKSYLVKKTLDNTEQDLLLLSQSAIQEMTFLLHYFLIITNDSSIKDGNLDFFTLKNRILEKFTWFNTVELQLLLDQRNRLFVKLRAIIAKCELKLAEMIPILSFFEEIESLSTYLRLFLKKVPSAYILSFFTWGVFNDIKHTQCKSLKLFTICLEGIFHLFEIDFIPNSCIKYNRAEKTNIEGVKGVVQFIIALYYMQKSQVNCSENTLTGEVIQTCLDKAALIANLPENKEKILSSYNQLRQAIFKIEHIDAEYITAHYINNVISLLCYNIPQMQQGN